MSDSVGRMVAQWAGCLLGLRSPVPNMETHLGPGHSGEDVG